MTEMDPRLQAYLDGDMRLEELPPELRELAAGWDGLLEQVARSGPAGAPFGFNDRVMAGIGAHREPAGRRGGPRTRHCSTVGGCTRVFR
jgi:hypothetical protein